MFFLEEYRVTSFEQAGKNDIIIANPKKTPLPVRLILPLYIIWKPTNRFSSFSRPTNGPLKNNFAQGNSTASPGRQEIADTRNGTWPRDALRWLGKKSRNWLDTLWKNHVNHHEFIWYTHTVHISGQFLANTKVKPKNIHQTCLVYKRNSLSTGILLSSGLGSSYPSLCWGNSVGLGRWVVATNDGWLSLIGFEVLGFIAHLFFSDRTAFFWWWMEGQRAVGKSIGFECLLVLVTIPWILGDVLYGWQLDTLKKQQVKLSMQSRWSSFSELMLQSMIADAMMPSPSLSLMLCFTDSLQQPIHFWGFWKTRHSMQDIHYCLILSMPDGGKVQSMNLVLYRWSNRWLVARVGGILSRESLLKEILA